MFQGHGTHISYDIVFPGTWKEDDVTEIVFLSHVAGTGVFYFVPFLFVLSSGA